MLFGILMQKIFLTHKYFRKWMLLNADFRRTNVDAINTPSVWQSIAADCRD